MKDEKKKARELDLAAAKAKERILPLLRKRLDGWMKGIDGPDLVETSKPLGGVDPDLVKETEKLLLLSYAFGLDHASTSLTLSDDDYDSIPFDDAVDFLKSRVPLTKEEWKALEPKLRFRAFTLAALADHDAIDRVRRMTVAAVEKGTPFAEFWSSASAEAAAGLSEASPWYWETVFRTNVQTAYNAGRAAEFSRVQPEYLEFIGIEDGRQTDICAERSGTILPATDPFWASNWPPLHFNCRSTVRAVFQEEVDALREADPSWSPRPEEDRPSASTAKGFGGNPIETDSFWKLTPAMETRAEAFGIEKDLRSFAKTVGMEYDPFVASRMSREDRVLPKPKPIPTSKVERDALREEIERDLRPLRGKSFPNKALGESIEVTRKGIDKAVSYSADPEKLAILIDLPEMLGAITLLSKVSEKSGDPNYSEILKGRVAIEREGKKTLFEVVLKRRSRDGGLEFYEVLPFKMKD